MKHFGHFDYNRFFALLRAKADDMSMSVRTLGEEIGTSASTAHRLLRGEVPNLETFFAVCSWLDVSPALFYTKNAPDVCPECQRLRSVLNRIAEQAINAASASEETH